MTSIADVPRVAVSLWSGDLATCQVEFLIVPVFETDALADLADLDAATGGDIARALRTREFKGKPFETYATGRGGNGGRVLCIGAGPREKLTLERVRRLATAGAWAARQRGGSRIGLLPRLVGEVHADAIVRASADGLVLAALGADRYKSSPRDAAELTSALIVAPGQTHLAAAVERGALDGEHTNLARWLSDAPGNDMTPSHLAEQARTCLDGSGVVVEILDEAALEVLRMGLLLAVARGSAEPPRLIVMRYTPQGGPTPDVLALVGKGVTFDSGGISIKPADGMEKMKHDMSGGAAVIAAMRAIAALRPQVSVLGIVPAVENMPGGRALKPGDVVLSAEGKSVDVNNTDAEGRLILADALWYARQQGATHLVDVATLTGAVVIALGRFNSGLFASPDAWATSLREAAGRAGERFWALPVEDDYTELLKSDCADLSNTGGRAGGAISAAMFLKEFTGGLPWAHLDIAGTAWADDAKPFQPKGATGVAVRTMVELAMSARPWPA